MLLWAMLRAVFISSVVLPCEVGAQKTLIAPEGSSSSSPPIVYPDFKLSGLSINLCISSFSFTGISKLLNSVALSWSFISFTLLSSKSKAVTVSPLSCSSLALPKSLVKSLSLTARSRVEVNLSTVIERLSSVIPSSLIASREVNSFLYWSLSIGLGISEANSTTSSRRLSVSLLYSVPKGL